MRNVCWQTILMKHHTLFFGKLGKMSQNLLSPAVVIGALRVYTNLLVQALISVQALVFDLAQLTCQKRFDCRNAILGSSAILLGTSYS